MDSFISTAWAQAAGAGQAGAPSFSFFVPLIAVFLIFYFLMIRPQQKQQKQRQQMIAAIKKGDQVVLTSGIHGKVTGVADNVLTVEIADNVRVKMERDAVASVKVAAEGSAS